MSATKLQRAICGKTVVVTGASDGIGAHLAARLAAAGARVILVARTAEKLKAVGDEIRAAGGEAHEYLADISNDDDCKRAVEEILADHGSVDVFVSNAGRNIRRSVKYQGGERFHDFKRLMSLNYFGALRMILGVLPSMVEQKCGHIVHVSSCGVLLRQPRFAGYCSSKSALDGALQSMAAEVASQGVQTSTVHMPLVRTKMVESKGHSYDHFSMLTVDMACELIEHVIITKDCEVMDFPSRFFALLAFFRPDLLVSFNVWVYGLESEQAPDGLRRAKSEKEMELRRKRNAQGGCTPLKALGSFLSFCAKVEMFFRRIGLVSIVRDPTIILILFLVLAVERVVTTVMAVTSMLCMAVTIMVCRTSGVGHIR